MSMVPYYLHLEPKTIESLSNAQVLVLGSSLAQVSFSTKATEFYFKDRNLRYHLAGFGYDEGGRFPIAVLSGISGRPDLYIVHAHQFFTAYLSPVARFAMSNDATLNYLSKKFGAASAAWICRRQPHWCGGVYPSI